MKRMIRLLMTILCLGITAGHGIAEDSPEQLVRTAAEAPLEKQNAKETPDQRWQNFLAEHGWDAGLAAGGVIYIPERELIISSASAFTKVRVGQPGWLESRIVAFENAEMDAKTKIIRYLAESVETKRSLALLEKAQWNDGEVDKVRNLNEIEESLKRIGKKSVALAEKSLDKALQKLDPDYDPAKYEGKSVEDLKVIAEDLFNRQIKTVAMGTLIGVTPLYSTEGAAGEGEYQVLMGVIWSPKLNRLAMSLFNDEYNIPKVKPGKKLSEYIPADPLALLSTIGTRIVIDENGEYAVLAYAQAQPRRTGPGRRQAALHQAKQIAANRARAQLVNFIREGLTLRDSEASKELSREFSDMTFGTETIRDYRKMITGKRVKVKLSGLRILKEWSLAHPATGQQVAGAVVAWSPGSARLSKQAGEMMQRANDRKASQAVQGTKAQQGQGPALQSMKIDTSAY